MSISTRTGELPSWLQQYLSIEESATEFRVHSPYLVCGLLQTPEYAAAIARSVGVTPPGEDYVDRTVRWRRIRQRRVRSGELEVVAVQHEFALRLEIGGRATMRAQLASLAELCDLPNVTVYLVPNEAGLYEALRIGSFTLLSNPADPDPVVHLEGHDGGWLVEGGETAPFAEAFEHARKLALSPAESRRFITRVEQDWRPADE